MSLEKSTRAEYFGFKVLQSSRLVGTNPLTRETRLPRTTLEMSLPHTALANCGVGVSACHSPCTWRPWRRGARRSPGWRSGACRRPCRAPRGPPPSTGCCRHSDSRGTCLPPPPVTSRRPEEKGPAGRAGSGSSGGGGCRVKLKCKQGSLENSANVSQCILVIKLEFYVNSRT